MPDIDNIDIDNRVFIIPNCGSGWIYHYIVYMINRLIDIPTDAFHDSENKTIRPKYHMINVPYNGIYKEVIDHISDKYEYINNLNEYIANNPNTNKIDLEPCSTYHKFIHPVIGECHIKMDGYPFLRKLLLKDYVQPEVPFRKLYLTRKDSHLLDGNKADKFIKRRQVVNDEEVKAALEPLGFEYIQLENYELIEKIKLFSEAKLVVSPNSGGLTFSLCANKKTTIFEINTPSPHQYSKQFIEMCTGLGINHHLYHSIKKDGLDNMYIDTKNLIDKLKSLNLL